MKAPILITWEVNDSPTPQKGELIITNLNAASLAPSNITSIPLQISKLKKTKFRIISQALWEEIKPEIERRTILLESTLVQLLQNKNRTFSVPTPSI